MIEVTPINQDQILDELQEALGRAIATHGESPPLEELSVWLSALELVLR